MEQLSHNDIHSLNNAIGEIYSARDMESFYKSAFSALPKIISNQIASFNDVEIYPPHILNGVHSSNGHHRLFKKLLHAFNEHCHEHPFCVHFESESVIKTTDLVTRDMFKGLALYNEYYRHVDIDTQVVMSFEGEQGRRTLLALSRKGMDFSERDRLMLTLLRPHIINAVRNVKELGRFKDEIAMLHKAADDDSRSVALLERDGKVKWISRRARYYLAEYLGASLTDMYRLPLELEEWVRRQSLFPEQNGERKPLRIERAGRWLVIRLVRGEEGSMLLMKEEMPVSLEATGLTPREAEVLHWIAKGKTDKEISLILNISDRTVQKHHEHIYAKLGVETRTAAAAMVINL